MQPQIIHKQSLRIFGANALSQLALGDVNLMNFMNYGTFYEFLQAIKQNTHKPLFLGQFVL